jgi:hypothetical protein
VSWDVAPTDSGSVDIQAYHFVRQFYAAICEKVCARGGGKRWPAGHVVFSSGTISSIVDNGDGTNTLTDDDADWSAFPVNCSGTSRWVDVVCTEDPNTPASYDVVIEGGGTDDETMVVRGAISENDDNSLTFEDLSKYVTGNIIESLDSLVGKEYFIIRRGGLFWTERWPTWPNGYPTQEQVADGDTGKQELWRGSVDSGNDYSLSDDDDDLTNLNTPDFQTRAQQWKTDRWKDKEVLFFDTDGLLHRETIKSNDAKTIFWHDPPADPDTYTSIFTPTGDYIIVEAGARGLPGRRPSPVKWWYSGYQEPYYSHFPNDAITPLAMPVATIFYTDGEFPDCEDDVPHDAFDVDIHTAADNRCDEHKGDHFFAPDVYKTRRMLQAVIEGLSIGFFDITVAPTSVTATELPLFHEATVFNACGINSGTTTIGSVDTGTSTATIDGATLPTPTPDSPAPDSLPVYFVIRDDTGKIRHAGTDGVIQETTFSAPGLIEAFEGMELVYSFGWSRYYPREFHRYYPQTCFIADVDSGEGGAGAIDPPRVVDLEESGCFGVGQWIHRGPSLNYLETTGLGFFFESAGAIDDAPAFIAGELARYAGTHWAMPDVGLGPSSTMTMKVGSNDDDLPYWDHFTIGNHLPAAQARIKSSMAGKATGGATNYLRDDGKNWYTSVWYSTPGGGVMRSESGTASEDGTPTSLVDSTKTNAIDSSVHCFWEGSRFVGSDSAYEDFPIKITQTRDVDGEPVTTTWHSVITSTTTDEDGTTINFRMVHGMPEVKEGDQYAIDEPYEINRWQKRMVRITKPDGTKIEAEILWSDDVMLFFDDLDDEASVEVGDAYAIIEVPVGSVLQWDDTDDPGKWVAPNRGDADPRGEGTGGGLFVDPNSGNLPTTVKAFGRSMVGDYSGIQWLEMYQVLNQLRKTPKDFGFTSRADPDTPEANERTMGQQFFIFGHSQWSSQFDAAEAAWSDNSTNAPHEADNLPPTALSSGNVDTNVGAPITITRRYAYAKVTGLPTCMSSTVQIYAYATFQLDQPEIFYYGAFDDSGDGLVYNAWDLLDTFGPDDAADRISDQIGDIATAPDRPADPPHAAEEDGGTGARGYEITFWKGIIDWAPGMKYLD